VPVASLAVDFTESVACRAGSPRFSFTCSATPCSFARSTFAAPSRAGEVTNGSKSIIEWWNKTVGPVC
jgi:hypothetical protein